MNPNANKKDKFPKGMVVKVFGNNIEQAITQLKRKLNDDGFKKELRAREYFVSKGEQRRKDKAAGIARYRKTLAEKSKGQ